MHVGMYVCMYAYMYACMHVCMYACMHICIYAYMHICMYTLKVVYVWDWGVNLCWSYCTSEEFIVCCYRVTFVLVTGVQPHGPNEGGNVLSTTHAVRLHCVYEDSKPTPRRSLADYNYNIIIIMYFYPFCACCITFECCYKRWYNMRCSLYIWLHYQSTKLLPTWIGLLYALQCVCASARTNYW